MPGTKAGGLKAAATNKDKYGQEFYKHIGARGGAASGTGGFAYFKAIGNIKKIQEAGRKGGRISRIKKRDV